MERIDASRLSLNEVFGVVATAEVGVYRVHCNVADTAGEIYDCEYISRPDDLHGLNPTIRRWLDDHPDYSIVPYTPPADEDIRRLMPSLTARQLRLGLMDAGITSTEVVAAIEKMPTERDRKTTAVEWEYATNFERCHPLITAIGNFLGLTNAQIDLMWRSASQI